MTAPRTVKNSDFGVWLPLLERYSLSAASADMLLRGVLREGVTADSSEVLAVARAWGHLASFETTDGRVEVVVLLPGEPVPDRLWLHATLFLATLFTTLAAGALLAGVDPFRTRLLERGVVELPYPTAVDWSTLWVGSSFAVPLLTVLLGHEMGHWAAARRHGIRSSLPYFIPFPPYFSIIGTMGAFIRLRGATLRRSDLFDVGASGPLVSFLLSIPLLAVGLKWSTTVPGTASAMTPFVVSFAGTPVWLGNGLLLEAMTAVFGPSTSGGGVILLHPVAFAGWLGLFVTALNLLPIGQLDGGHVLYALLGPRQARFGRLFLLALLPLGLLWWGWWAWGGLIAFLHRGRVGHARVVQPEVPVGAGRDRLGWLVLVVFFLTFVPLPLRLIS